MTGIDDPYEPPSAPELELRPAEHPDAVEQVLAALEQRGVIEASTARTS